MDVVGGGRYRLEFGYGGTDTSVFYGKYLDVVPNERIVRTNDEGDEGAVTTVTFEDRDGRTLLTYHDAPFTIEPHELCRRPQSLPWLCPSFRSCMNSKR